VVLVLALLLWSWSWSLEFGLVYIIGDGQYQRIYPTGRYREKNTAVVGWHTVVWTMNVGPNCF